MILVDEPGPIKLIPISRFPYGRGNRREFETLAARASQQLSVTNDVIGGPLATMQQASAARVDDDFARTIPGAVAEINAQLGTQSDVDPARMYVAALESLADLDGAGAGLSSAASGANASPPGGGTTFEAVSWAIAGEGGSSGRPGAPPPSQPGAPPSGDASPPPPATEQPADAPAPPPPPEEAPTFGEPPPEESDEPLF